MKDLLIQQLRELVRQPDYRPANKSELARALGVTPKERKSLREAIVELENSGEIVAGKKSRYHLPSRNDQGETQIGTIRFSKDRKRRSAWFFPANSEASIFASMENPRIFVPGRFCSTALDGDEVEVRLSKQEPPRWHKHSRKHQDRIYDEEETWQAQVVQISKRKTHKLVGTFHGKGSRASLASEDSKLPPRFQLIDILPEASTGDVVAAEFVEWSDPNLPPVARMTEILGREDTAGIDILRVIHRLGLPLEFPAPVLAEAEEIPDLIDDEEIVRREDWREREVFTIDPEDARDFDDAISVTKLEDGWEVAIHIADVSHYVKPDSELDKEARRRGNSVYLADRVIPMLPEKLSNGVCSLKPDVERLTHAAVLRFDSSGARKSARFVSAVICSARRFSYEEAFALMRADEATTASLESGKDRQLASHLKRAWKLAEILRRRRFDEGALNLDFPEVRVLLDENGRPTGAKKSIYDESHQLIEEFMLAANEAVALETKNDATASVYRIHEDPDPGKLEEFAELARTFGHEVHDVTRRAELQKLLRSIRGTIGENGIKLALLKSLKRAAYSGDPLGHYGLAKANYTHFTSPIRRYADLAVHRVLRKILSRRHEPTAPEVPDRTPKASEIRDFARHISETERIAAEAEQETRRIKIYEYLENLVAEDADISFAATIQELRPIGAFVEIDDLLIRGLIRKNDLPRYDEYFFDRLRNEFRSRTNAPPLRAGESICVRLLHIDRERGFVDFAPV